MFSYALHVDLCAKMAERPALPLSYFEGRLGGRVGGDAQNDG